MSSENAAVGTGWSPVQWVGAVVAWLWVIVPFGYGVYELIVKIPALFR